MRRMFLLSLIILLLGFSYSITFAEDLYTKPEMFVKFNPDGKKYDYVKAYIKALSYIYANEERRQWDEDIDFSHVSTLQGVEGLIKNLTQDNINLRVARNFVQKYNAVENGLILKSVDLFTSACEKLINLNEEERSLIDNYKQKLSKGNLDDFDYQKFHAEQQRLLSVRKTINNNILEASMLISKILISNQKDEYGELVRLGVTSEQRLNLLFRLNEFVGKGFDGDMRSGQTYIQASVSAIRNILEDYSWNTIDGDYYGEGRTLTRQKEISDDESAEEKNGLFTNMIYSY